MRIYIAGFGNGKLCDIEPKCDYHVLESYYYINPTIERVIERSGKRIFMDSGAFSARSLGVDIKLDEYIAYLKSHEHLYEMAAILDAPIGDCEGSYRVFNKMLDAGCKGVKPVMHGGEDPKWAEKYIREGHDYLLLGGLVRYGRHNLIPYLDRLFERVICDDKGRPRIKTHGFGLTSLSLVKRYPWTSTDSTRWLMGGKAGYVLLPFDDNIRQIMISVNSPYQKKINSHYDSLSPTHQREVVKIITAMGHDIEKIRTNYRVRNRFNVEVFSKYANLLSTDVFHPEKKMELFDA